MKYISVADDIEKCRAVANENEYSSLNIETARLLNECVGMSIAIKEGGEEKMEMCKAMKGIKEEGRTEAILITISTLQELGHSSEVIIKTLADKFSISEKQVEEYMKAIEL